MSLIVNSIGIKSPINSSQNNNSICFKSDPLPQDKAEFSTKKSGLSNPARFAIGVGTLGIIIGGILLCKRSSTKAAQTATEVIQNATTELSQAVKDLVSQGKITQKEAELFNNIHNLEGEEFVTKAYELLAKDMNLEKYPKLIVSTEEKGNSLGHTGQDIKIFINAYEKFYGKENAKQEIINTLRHELQHYKQDLIIFMQRGENEFHNAFVEQKRYDLVRKSILRDAELDTVLNEEAAKYGYNPDGVKEVGELIETAYEHDTPIKTLREMTPCDFEKLHLTQEELAKADEFLEGYRTYLCSECFPKKFYNVDGEFDMEVISRNPHAVRYVSSYLHRGYWQNPIETDARQAGERFRDNFRTFLDAIKN